MKKINRSHEYDTKCICDPYVVKHDEARPSDATACNGDTTLRPGHVYEGNICWWCRRVHGNELYCSFCHGALVDHKCADPNCLLSTRSTDYAPGEREALLKVEEAARGMTPGNASYQKCIADALYALDAVRQTTPKRGDRQ